MNGLIFPNDYQNTLSPEAKRWALINALATVGGGILGRQHYSHMPQTGFEGIGPAMIEGMGAYGGTLGQNYGIQNVNQDRELAKQNFNLHQQLLQNQINAQKLALEEKTKQDASYAAFGNKLRQPDPTYADRYSSGLQNIEQSAKGAYLPSTMGEGLNPQQYNQNQQNFVQKYLDQAVNQNPYNPPTMLDQLSNGDPSRRAVLEYILSNPSSGTQLLDNLLPKQQGLVNIPEGGELYDPNLKKVVAEGKPKEDKSDTTKIIESWASAMFEGRKWSELNPQEKQAVLAKLQNNAIQVRMSAPPIYNVVQTAEGMTPFNVRTGQPSGEPIGGKPLPSEQITAQQQIGTLQETVGRVKGLFKPEYVGPIAGRVAGAKEATVGLGSEQAQFNSDLAQMQNTLVYLMSGKQINETEYQRLKRQLPDKNLPVSVFKARLDTFEKTLNSIVEGRAKASGGYGANIKGSTPQPQTNLRQKYGY